MPMRGTDATLPANKEAPMKKLVMTLTVLAFLSGSAMAAAPAAEKDTKAAKDKPAKAAQTLKFFDWAYAKGDKMAEDLDYVPMPDKVVGAIKKSWSAQIKDRDGRPLFAMSN